MTHVAIAAPRDRALVPGRRGRIAVGVVALAAALATAIALSLMVGSHALSFDTVLDALGGEGNTHDRYVVSGLRVPRTVTGLVVGMALGVSGALMQAFARNPLADPGILGVNAGAAFAVACGVAILGIYDVRAQVWLAFAGALVVTVGVYLIGSAGRGSGDPIRLTLAGVALGAVFSGITTGLVLSDPDAFEQMRAWNAGSLLGRGFDVLIPVSPFIAAGLVGALALAPGLNALALGDDVARAQGARVTGIRVGVIVAVTVLAGTATALAGPIAFVGLMVPHVARWMFGVDQRVIIAFSALMAPIIILTADVLGRILIAPSEIPVGIVTAFVGAPVLIALARRRQASTLS